MDKNKKRIGARSKENGIMFYSTESGIIGLETYYEPNGEMQSNVVVTELDELRITMEMAEIKNNIFTIRKLIIFDVALFIISLVVSIMQKDYWIIGGAIYYILFASKGNYSCVASAYIVKYKNASIGRFHAAEHMVINAYYELGRIPSLDEIKNFSRFSKECGSRKGFFYSLFFTFFSFIIVFLSDTVYYLIAILLIIVFVIGYAKLGWFKFLQILVTNKPSDKELKLAIEGLKRFEEFEGKVKRRERILYS